MARQGRARTAVNGFSWVRFPGAANRQRRSGLGTARLGVAWLGNAGHGELSRVGLDNQSWTRSRAARDAHNATSSLVVYRVVRATRRSPHAERMKGESRTETHLARDAGRGSFDAHGRCVDWRLLQGDADCGSRTLFVEEPIHGLWSLHRRLGLLAPQRISSPLMTTGVAWKVSASRLTAPSSSQVRIPAFHAADAGSTPAGAKCEPAIAQNTHINLETGARRALSQLTTTTKEILDTSKKAGWLNPAQRGRGDNKPFHKQFTSYEVQDTVGSRFVVLRFSQSQTSGSTPAATLPACVGAITPFAAFPTKSMHQSLAGLGHSIRHHHDNRKELR